MKTFVDQCLASVTSVLRHHINIPSALAPLVHHSNKLLKLFSLLLVKITAVFKLNWENASLLNMHARCTKILESPEDHLDISFILWSSVIAQKVRHNILECDSSMSLIVLYNFDGFRIFHKLPDLKAIENDLLT